MSYLSLLFAALVMQQAETPGSVPPAKELTQMSLVAFKALPPEEESWGASISLIRALALIGDDEQAVEIALSDGQSVDSTLRRYYAPALALRLKDVPDEMTLHRLAKGDTHERILMLSEITKALAEADQPVVAEQALKMITGHERSALLQALRASMVAQAYRHGGNEEGERRVLQLGISQSIRTEPALFVFKDFKTHLRAIALGEQEIVRELLIGAENGVQEFLSSQLSETAAYWSRLGLIYETLGEREKAEGAFEAARTWCKQIENQAKNKSDFTNAIYQYVILSSGLRMAGYDEKADQTYQYAEEFFRNGKADAATLDRRWIYRVLAFDDKETLSRLFEVIESRPYRIAILNDAARLAIERDDPSSQKHLAAALAEFQKVPRLRELNDGYFSANNILLDLAEVHALGGEKETATRLFNRAARRAERSRMNSEYYLSQVLCRTAEVGLVEVAWSILPKIPTDSPEYARSIATLTVEVAKREAASPTMK